MTQLEEIARLRAALEECCKIQLVRVSAILWACPVCALARTTDNVYQIPHQPWCRVGIARAALAIQPAPTLCVGPTFGVWRVGKQPQNLYDGDRFVCRCHNAEDAAWIAARINASPAMQEAADALADPTHELDPAEPARFEIEAICDAVDAYRAAKAQARKESA